MSDPTTPDRSNRPAPRGPLRQTDWPAGVSRPLVSPLQASVVYASESPDSLDAQYLGGAAGWTYAREGHPNAATLAKMIDGMEGLSDGVITGAGMAAISAALLAVAKAGDHVVGADQLYGRSLRLMSEDLPRLGIATSFADATSVEAVAAAITPQTTAILVEVVANPTIRIADLEGIANLARDRGIRLIVDNTFTTPRALRPVEYGADIVVHSVTKLLAGHSDATLGYVAARDPEIAEALAVLSATWGFTPSPFDCWMAERGLLSFELRYDRAEANAVALAEALAQAPSVTRVLYPGRADHPDAARAAQLLGKRTGNMVTFDVAGGRAAANALVRAMPNVAFAPTLGDVATTLSNPATSSHRGLTPEGRAALGINDGTFRISVGIEPIDILLDAFTKGSIAAAAI